MKAVEWIEKFKDGFASDAETAKALFLEEYGTETAELLERRTSGSKPNTRLAAGDGAVREQRQKFQKIKGAFPALTDEDFEGMVSKACTDFRAWEAQAKKRAEDAAKAKAEAEKRAQEGGNSGRKFGQKNVEGKSHGGNGGGNKKHHNRKPFHERQRGKDGKPQQGKPKYDHPNRIGDVPAELMPQK